ncbi:MAG: hypothetical protein AB1695_14540 [Stygiobacter sp.]
MAELNKHLFGKLKGTFGSAVFRQRNGKNYISQKPVSYTPPNNENYFIRTSKFKVAAKIASTIHTNENLKNIWSIFKPKNQSLYNYLISVVYPELNDNSVNHSLQITPASSFNININSTEVNSNNIKITLQTLNNNDVDTSSETNCKLTSIIFMNTPSTNGIYNFDVYTISSEPKQIDVTNPLEFNFTLSSLIQDKINQHQEKMLFMSLLTYDNMNNLINYSSTSFYQM